MVRSLFSLFLAESRSYGRLLTLDSLMIDRHCSSGPRSKGNLLRLLRPASGFPLQTVGKRKRGGGGGRRRPVTKERCRRPLRLIRWNKVTPFSQATEQKLIRSPSLAFLFQVRRMCSGLRETRRTPTTFGWCSGTGTTFWSAEGK